MSECLRIAQGLFFLPCIRDTRGHHGPQGDRRVPLGKSCLCWSTLEVFSPLFPGGLAVKILLKYSVSEEHFLCFFGDVLKVLPRYSEDLQSDRQLQSKLTQLESIKIGWITCMDFRSSGLFLSFIWTGLLSYVRSGINHWVSYFRC